MAKKLYRLYNSEVELAFDPEASGHRYIANGTPVPGVTTILGALAKPALIGWAANMAVDHVKNGLKKELKKEQLEALFDEARKAYAQKRDAAGDVGTTVHEFIQHYPQKKVLPQEQPAKAMCEALMKWYDQNVARDLEVEVPIYSQTYHYAGTPDRLVMTKDRQVVLLDFKTGKRVYPEQFVQTGGYSFALREEFRANVDDHWIVNVPKVKEPKVELAKLSDLSLPVAHAENTFIQTWHLYSSLRGLKSGK